MLYLFILESIGTSELLLIGLVALIVFGPRKLPELARMLGKARSEFKRTTDEFKQTWEREVDFENIEKQGEAEMSALRKDETVQRIDTALKNEIVVPELKEIAQTNIQNEIPQYETVPAEPTKNNLNDKRDWL